MVSVTKEVTFDAAHMLSNYSGLCSNLHGHTYHLRIKISTDDVEDMVLDFNILKQLIQSVIVNVYDHALIFADESHRGLAEEELYQWASKFNKKFTSMSDGRPTAENISKDILQRFKAELPGREIQVTLWETPTSFVERSE